MIRFMPGINETHYVFETGDPVRTSAGSFTPEGDTVAARLIDLYRKVGDFVADEAIAPPVTVEAGHTETDYMAAGAVISSLASRGFEVTIEGREHEIP